MIASLTFEDERNPTTVDIDQDLTLIGSGVKADILIEDPKLSPLHCAIIHTRDRWKILDLYSRQGTRVNDQPISDHILQTGDRIMLGKTSAIFEITKNNPSVEGGEIKLEYSNGQSWPLEFDSALIGSWEGCDIVVDGAELAHVIVVYSHCGAVVRAIGAKGIIIVNDQQTEKCILQDDDVLQVGEVRFTVRALHLPRRSDHKPTEGTRTYINDPEICDTIGEPKQITQLLDTVVGVPDEIKQLRVQVETLGTQFTDLRLNLPQQLADALKGLDRTDQPGSAKLAEQRAVLAEQEQRLAEERKTLEETRWQVISQGEEILSEIADAEQQHEQHKADLDMQKHLLTERELQLDLLRQEAEREHRRREQSLQGKRQKLHTIKIEAEIRDAHTSAQASKLIRLCHKVAQFEGAIEGTDASLQLIAFAKNIACKIEQPGRIIASAKKKIATGRLHHTPSSSGDSSESLAPSSVGSSPNSFRNS